MRAVQWPAPEQPATRDALPALVALAMVRVRARYRRWRVSRWKSANQEERMTCRRYGELGAERYVVMWCGVVRYSAVWCGTVW